MKSAFFVLSVLFIASGVFSQKAELTISGAFEKLKPAFHAGNYRFLNSQNRQFDGAAVVIAASASLKYGLYIGAEVGLHSGDFYINHTIDPVKENYVWPQLGHYEVNQFHVFLIPEYHFLKNHIFVKGGIGICKDFCTRFTNGIEILPGSASTELTGRSYQRMSAAGSFIGAGAQAKIMGKLGVKIEARYTKTKHGAISDDQIIYRFNYINFLGGLTFSL